MEVTIRSAADIKAAKELRDNEINLVVGNGVNHYELAALVVKHGHRVKTVRLATKVGSSAHIAIICRQYGVQLL